MEAQDPLVALAVRLMLRLGALPRQSGPGTCVLKWTSRCASGFAWLLTWRGTGFWLRSLCLCCSAAERCRFICVDVLAHVHENKWVCQPFADLEARELLAALVVLLVLHRRALPRQLIPSPP